MKKLLLLFAIVSAPISLLNAQSNLDTCALADAATPLTVSGTFTVDMIDGSEIPLPVCSENGIGATNGEWYKFTPSVTDLVNITTDLPENAGKDTRLQVYTGTCASLTCLAGDDDSGTGYLSNLDFNVTAGETYYIAWDNKWSSSGFNFEITVGTPPPPPSPSTFTSVTIAAIGSDRAIVDMNNDKLDDLVTVRSDDTNSIYELQIHYQLASGGLNKVVIPTAEPPNDPTWSLSAGDIDANGYNDLLYGATAGVTFMIANSNGTAYNITQPLNVNNPNIFSQRSNFIDINNDGHLDAFMCHDVDPNVYFLNDGTGAFNYYKGTNGPITSGLGLNPSGGNYGTVWVDYDNDRDMDMFIAKCRGGANTAKINELWRNNGNDTFTNVAAAANLEDPVQTWSSAWADFDNDGDMDAYIGASSFTDGPHKLMINNGDGTFTDSEDPSVNPAPGTDYYGIDSAPTGIENAPADFNNDGYVDILTDGEILFNDGDGTFTLYDAGMPPSGPIGDVNNDGFLDVFNGNLRLNDGNSNNWIKVCTIGATGSGKTNINGIGARVEINSPGLGTQIRDVRSGEGFRYMSSLNTHFGIGADASINSLTIYWPSGIVDVILNPAINDTICVTEGETLSLENSLTTDLILYPNPTKDILNLNASYGFDDALYSVFDITGRRVMNSKFSSNSIDVSKLSAGNYILRIIHNGVIKSQKFIKQ